MLKHFIRKRILCTKPVISKGSISIFSCSEGFKIFNENYELTKNVGLNFSWEEDDGIKDSSIFSQKTITWKKSLLKTLLYSPSSPVKIVLELIICGQSIDIKVQIQALKPIKNFKIILMANENYKTWISDIHEGTFPTFKAWQSIGTPSLKPKYVGLKRISLKKGSLPIPVILSFENAVHSIENSDKDVSARLLAASYFKEISESSEFKGEILFFKSQNSYNKFILNKRQSILSSLNNLFLL